MARKIAAGKKGKSAQYITRNVALKKLQLSLAEFRRLCIFKGIYPREPKKKISGADKLYYHKKDISFLQHEPLVDQLRRYKAHMKKYRKCVARNEKNSAKSLYDLRPRYSLHHIVKERYPSLKSALENLDDALCLIAAFAGLPANNMKSISGSIIEECMNLLDEFHFYVIKGNFIRKTFISIKGYYFQAQILGVPVTWLLPHQFSQELPSDVDFKVLLSFLDVYRTMLKFVNFKLYNLMGLSYPPDVSKAMKRGGRRFLSLKSKQLKQKVLAEALEAPSAASSVDSKVNEGSVDAHPLVKEEEEKKNQLSTLFSGLVFFINREAPLFPASLCVLSCGGKVAWSGADSPHQHDDQSITHEVCDRDSTPGIIQGREYIQPQWLFDSVNSCVRLPIREYSLGVQLPPHLSPFVNDEKEGYVPERKRELERIVSAKFGANLKPVDEDFAEVVNEKIEESHFADIEAEESLRKNETGVGFSKEKNIGGSAIEEAAEDGVEGASNPKRSIDDLRKAMLSKKHKRLLDRIEFGQRKKQAAADKLMKKRKMSNEAPCGDSQAAEALERF